jgi:hypothetical protein
MGEIIASLDGYFCLPGHNVDWKHAGVSRAIPQRARSHGMEAKEFRKILMRWQEQSPQRVVPRFAVQSLATTV